jgi:hypothetical protein
MAKLERCQNEAARKIVGAISSSPIDAVLLEANLEPIQQRGDMWSTLAYERSLRLNDNHPRRKMAEASPTKRLKRREWRLRARETWKELFSERSTYRFPPPIKPWLSMVKSSFDLEGNKTVDETLNREQGERKLRMRAEVYDMSVFTDGSAADNTNGGAGFVVYDREETIVTAESTAAGHLCSSFQTEMVAINAALSWLSNNSGRWQKARIASDSLSSLATIQRTPCETKNNLLHNTMNSLHELRDK